MQRLYIDGTGLSGAPSFASAAGLILTNCNDCSLSETDVDAWLSGIYTRWAASGFTYATPSLNIGGTGATINAAPSGTYQDGDPPTTGLEYVYELANDPETTGEPTWSITYNGGSAP